MEFNWCEMKIVAVANPAGGVGKTTLAHALAVASIEFGKKILLIDLDPAAGLTFKLGLENPRFSITDFLSGTKSTSENILTTSERFDFIPADSRATSLNNLTPLKDFLVVLPKEYDVVYLDLPATLTPSLSLALEVSDLVLVPVRNTLHAIRGLIQLRTLNVATAIAIGEIADFDISPKIDEVIEISEEINKEAAKCESILSLSKSSSVAESYRSATYSVLEILGLE